MNEDVLKDLDALRTDIRRLLQRFADIAWSKETEISDELAAEWRVALESMEAKANELASRVRSNGTKLVAAIDQSLKDHPVGTLAATLAIGALIGALLRK